ncbi:hypothetical protein QQ045_031099 [Rhodiola kirilowii]
MMMMPVSDIRLNHHFVLIHGICHGAWCWYKLKCLMENSGFRVTCLDLKSAGIDPTDPNDVLTFEEYNKPLINMLQELPESERVILVGHSAGGLSVTRACGMFKDKILLAIYVGATMLRNGLCTTEDIKIGVPDLSDYGEDVYDLQFGNGTDHPPTSALIKTEFRRKILYHMCSQEDSNLAALLLKPGPLQAILGAKFDQLGSPVDAVPRIFIETVQDRVITPEQQDAMIEKWPPENVYSIDSDHSPFFSAPFLLLGLLVKATASLPTI